MTVRVYIFAADTPEPLEWQIKLTRRVQAGVPINVVTDTVTVRDLLNEKVMRPLAIQIHNQFKEDQNG